MNPERSLDAVTTATRLTCCSCGADLGDASDPYRDPDCERCAQQAINEELERDLAWQSQSHEVEYDEPETRTLWISDIPEVSR
jgi:hypothetical protein